MGNQQTTHRAGEPSYAPPGAMAALDDVQAGWNAGAGPWNPDALAQLYMEDALLFGGRPHMSVGRSGIREYFASYSHIFVSIRLELVDQHILALAPDVFATQGFGLFAFQLTDGRSTRSRMRTTLVLVRHEGGWRIRQHHFSTVPEQPPIGDAAEDQKAG